ERLEAERLESERLDIERVEAELAEALRLEAEHAEAERRAAEALEAEERDAEEFEAANQNIDDVDPMVAELLAAIALDPDPDAEFDFTGLDPELIDIFVEESRDLLDHSDGLLARLREAPGDREPVVGMQRDLHTLKGGAR